MLETIVDKIKSRGYTRVVIRPSTYKDDRIKTLAECRNIIEQCKVSMRGWDFPHIDKDTYAADHDYIYSGTDWSRYKEYWRLYQSGQFIYLEGMPEDWNEETIGMFLPNGKPLGFKGFAIDSNIYRFTEIVEFAARLATRSVFDGNVHLEISLFDTLDRKLFIYDRSRAPLFDNYLSKMQEITFSKTYSESEIMGNGPQIAMEIAIYFFERFNWQRTPTTTLTEMQQKFLSGRY